ncbi:MAG: hypothetical protein JXA99_16575 [Candidatus Lokiarchaeota archaeon]|nr:hypothetical protein [Candidatus Lokiarchaeota archaeon]
MIEEKLVSRKGDNRNNFEIINFKKNEEKEDFQEKIYNQIIKLINSRKSIIFGPEKSKTAKFISKNYLDVYKILKNYNNNNKSD